MGWKSAEASVRVNNFTRSRPSAPSARPPAKLFSDTERMPESAVEAAAAGGCLRATTSSSTPHKQAIPHVHKRLRRDFLGVTTLYSSARSKTDRPVQLFVTAQPREAI